ncbi:zinc finger MYM-type protein 2-like [Rhizophagus irregularis DAOM 181602=DAOM 197198]|nr:zinc finger MYM-type protein 2-like [Rhizophagus irregularis DAOM 181602=DAOM 197198]
MERGYNFIIIHEKNNQGGLNSRRKKGKTNQPRISVIPPDEFGTTNGSCHDISKYLRLRPENAEPNFYLRPISDIKKINEDLWYFPLHLGRDKLNQMLKTIATETGIDTVNKKISNHSTRKSAIQNLNNQDVDAQQIMAFSGHHSLAGVNAYRMPNEKQMMEVTKKAFPAQSNPSIVGKSSTLNTTRSSEFTRNSPISIKVVSKEEHCESIIGLKSTSTKEIESTKVTKRDKFKTTFKGKFRSPLIDLNKKVPSDDSQSSQNMTLDLEGMKVHITNCNVSINISKN